MRLHQWHVYDRECSHSRNINPQPLLLLRRNLQNLNETSLAHWAFEIAGFSIGTAHIHRPKTHTHMPILIQLLEYWCILDQTFCGVDPRCGGSGVAATLSSVISSVSAALHFNLRVHLDFVKRLDSRTPYHSRIPILLGSWPVSDHGRRPCHLKREGYWNEGTSRARNETMRK